MQDWLVGWSPILLQELQNLLTRKDFDRIILDHPRPYSHLLSTILPLYNGHFWKQKQSSWSMPVLSIWINPAVGNWGANNTFIPLPRSHEQCRAPKIVWFNILDFRILEKLLGGVLGSNPCCFLEHGEFLWRTSHGEPSCCHNLE